MAALPLWTNAVHALPSFDRNQAASSLSLHDILPLSPAADELWSDIILASYVIDMPWLLQTVPSLRQFKGYLTILSGEKGTATCEVRWAADTLSAQYVPKSKLLDSINPIEAAACRAGMPRERLTVLEPPLPIPYGTHHTKMILAVNGRGLRVAVLTANFVCDDWMRKAQGCYVQDFPRRPVNEAAGRQRTSKGDSFREYLQQYLRHCGVLPCGTSVEMGSFFDSPNPLDCYDFSEAKVALVASVPGSHGGGDVHLYGQNRLRALLACLPSAARRSPKHDAVVLSWQYSSQGALNERFLQSLQSSMTLPGHTCSDVQIIYPTEFEVRTSVEGWRAGLSLPLFVRNCHTFVNERLHCWRGPSAAVRISRRGHPTEVIDIDREETDDDETREEPLSPYSWRYVMPHIKSYASMDEQRQGVHWLLLTSANLSQAAWGTRTTARAKSTSDEKLFVRSYEMGVLYSADSVVHPGKEWLSITPSHPIKLPVSTNSAHLYPTPLAHTSAHVYLPYSLLRPVPYASTAQLRGRAARSATKSPATVSMHDIPWVVDMPHHGMDCLSRDIAGAVDRYSPYGRGSWTAPVRKVFLADGDCPSPAGVKRGREGP